MEQLIERSEHRRCGVEGGRWQSVVSQLDPRGSCNTEDFRSRGGSTSIVIGLLGGGTCSVGPLRTNAVGRRGDAVQECQGITRLKHVCHVEKLNK